MANIRIFTNNPMAEEKYPLVSVMLKTDVAGVFAAARNEIHQGAVIINHPLSGSVKPNESPYKSLVLSTDRGALDFKSLQLIESAEETLRKLPVKNRRYMPQVLEDFQVIDLDLLDSAMGALPTPYHI